MNQQFESIGNSAVFFKNRNKFAAGNEFVIFYHQLIYSAENRKGNKS